MGSGLFECFRDLVEQADEVLGYSIERLCLDDPEGLLNKTEYTQPAIYVTNALHLKQLERSAGRPDYLAGHSLGEYNALLAAGAFDFRTGLTLVKRRAELMAKAAGGGMAAVVGLSERELDDALRAHGADVAIANYNAPRQLVLAGSKAELARLRPVFERLTGVQAFIPLRTSGAFHSPHMEAAGREFRSFLERFDFAEPAIPVVANATGRLYTHGDVGTLLAEQITRAVRWTDSVQYLRRAGVSSFLEVGGGKVLTSLVEKIVAEEPPPGAPLLTTILEHCAARPDKTLLVFHHDHSVESLTGAELAGRVHALGAALASAMGPQDKAVLLFPHGANYVCTLLACWHANVVAIPTPVTNPAQLEQKTDVVEAILRSSGAGHLLCDEAMRLEASRLAERHGLGLVDVSRVSGGTGASGALRAVRESDLALVLYTSGSTSQPRGVMLDHGTIFRTASAEQWGVSEHSRVVTWLPKFHAFGISFGTLTPLVHGALGVAASPESFIREPASWFELIDRYGATHTGAPNFVFDYCCRSIDARALEGVSLASLRSLVCGGDIINQQHYERFARQFASLGLGPDVLTPNFGMSEAGPITLKTIGTPFKYVALSKQALEARRVEPAAPGDGARIVMSCGETDGVTRVIVVDPESGEPCPPDAVGELWVKTPRQAQGYLNDEAATRRTFHAALKTTGEGGFLRTGDLGFIVGRDVYIVGREKDVIVVNGKKYDPADLEHTLSGALDRYPAAKDHASGACMPCAAFSYEADDRERVVIVQEVDGVPPEQDCAELASGIVGIISQKFQLEVSDVVLAAKGAIPMTGSKKIRRRPCKEQFLSGELPSRWRLDRSRQSAGGAAAEGLERDDLVGVLRQAVLRPIVGDAAGELDESRPFGQLGLDSIQYIRFARRVETVFGVPFTPDLLYAHPTCAELAAHLAARGAARRAAAAPTTVERSARRPLSEGQRGLWVLHKREPDMYAYNVPVCLSCARVDIAALQAAFRHAVAQHPILAATVREEEGGAPYLSYGDAEGFRVEHVDISDVPREEVLARLQREVRRPFDLAGEPLVRLSVLARAEGEIYLLLVAHHIVLDGASTGVLLETLLGAYRDLVEGRASAAHAVTASFDDFVAWEREALRGPRAEDDRAFWLRELAGASPLTGLPVERVLPADAPHDGEVHSHRLPRDRAEAVRAFAERHQISPGIFFLAAFKALLYRYTGQDDLVVGVAVAGRSLERFDDVVGHFVNMIPIRSRPADVEGFARYAARLLQTMLTALGHAAYPFGRLVHDLGAGEPGARSPVFQVGYNYQSFSLESRLGELRQRASEALPFELVSGIFQTGEYDLSLDVVPGDGFTFNWKYHPGAFAGATVARMAEHLVNLIDAVLASSGEEALGRMHLLGAAEYQQLVHDWNRTETTDLGGKTCVDLFAEQAAAHPRRSAVTCGGATLTYREFDERSAALAASLRGCGIRAGDLVGLCADRSLETILGLLSILKCGAAYVPLDIELPPGRLSHMIEDSACKLIVGGRDALDALSGLGLPAARLHAVDGPEAASGLCDAVEAPLATADRAAYDAAVAVIYTSGSTGQPKGVAITHGGFANVVVDSLQRFGVTARDRLLAAAAFSFDMAAMELFLSLAAGGHYCACDPATVKDATAFAQTIARLQPTIMIATPSTWSRLFRAGWRNRGGVKILSGGEALSDALKDQMLASGGEAWNLYGPTETTMHAMAKRLRRDGPVTIGGPIANTQVYVLDAHLRPVPVGVPGELCVSGRGVARGYHDRPALTAERFLDDPFRPGQLLYRTGDRARRRPDGEIEWLGRLDDQIKLRGYRIELGEIEAALTAYPGITGSAVVVKKRDHGERLAAYFTAVPAGVDAPRLRAHLKGTLPAYMVPAELVQLPALPLTPHGKIDRQELSAIEAPVSVDPGPTAAAGSIERRLRAIFQEALGRGDFGRDEGFFDLGGDSFAAVVLTERINQAFGCRLKVAELFAHPSVQAMGGHLAALLAPDPAAAPDVSAGRGVPAKAGPSPRPKAAAGTAGDFADAVAIVGISCHFPGARDPREFWHNLRQGKDNIGFWSPDELRAFGVPEDLIHRPDYVPQRSVIDGQADFDPAFFSISPRDAELMDPQGRLLLLHAWKAIEDAGHRPEDVPNTSVFTAAGTNFYQMLLSSLVRTTTGPRIIESAEGYAAWMFAQGGSIPTMISSKLGLKGPSMHVGSNCSSALSALYLACQGLLAGESDLALVGAATIFGSASLGYVYQPGLNFSSSGRCRTFDAAADGMAGGEGVGAVLLRPARDAIADGDPIYCLIRGIAANNDGGDKAGFYAPSVRGQADVIRRVFEKTQIDPDTVCYVEAHGTGTRIGDPIEVAALTEAYRRYTARKQFCGLGSVKTNVGHLDAAAGMAGLIKVALGLRRGEIPRTLNYDKGNADIDWESSPFFVVKDNLRLDPERTPPHRAGLSSFGIGGTNVHALLEQVHPPPRCGAEAASEPSLVVLSAREGERVKALARSVLEFLPAYRSEGGDLRSLAYTLQVGRRAMASRVAFVVDDLDQLSHQLAAYVEGRTAEAFEGAVKSQGGDLVSLFDAADELKALKAAWLARRDWRKIASLWVSGVEIDWASCYGVEAPGRVNVPTYPFAAKHYWLAGVSMAVREAPAPAGPERVAELAGALEADAEVRLDAAGGEGFLARCARADADLDTVLGKLLFAQLSAMGLFATPERGAGLGRRHGIVETYARWLEHSVDVLIGEQYLIREGDLVRRHGDRPAADRAWHDWRTWKESRRGDPEVLAKARLAELMLEATPDVLTGRVPATQIMFPSSSFELVEAIYKQNARSDFFHGVLANTARAFVETLGRRGARCAIRIFEIGAGTGSASEHVFERLQDCAEAIAEYCYTDVSKAFVIEAEQRFGRRVPYATYRTYDAEKAPGTQGIAAGSYDVVIANNVLHATRNIVETIANTKALLSPGGVLLLNEMAENGLFGHVTFGLLEGWWRYMDGRRMAGGPALSPASWAEVLGEAGFHSVQFPAERAHGLGAQVIMAQAGPRAGAAYSDRAAARPAVKPAVLPAPPGISSTGSVEQYVEAAVREGLVAALKLGRDELKNDEPFADYGLDSLTGVNLVRQLNQALGTELEATVLFDYPTIGRLTGFISERYREELAARLRSAGAAAVPTHSVPVVETTAAVVARGPARGGKEPIAIIGMSGRFPRANGVEEFWRSLERGDDLITEAARWDLRALGSRCLHGGFMNDIDAFDPLFFNISGFEAQYMEPQQRLFLEEAWKALEDAGYAGGSLPRQRCGIYVGSAAGDYFDVGTSGDYPAQALWGNMGSLIPSRIAYYLDLHGPALTVDTACSSSLVAIYLACQGLWAGEADVAVAGGVFVQCTPKGYVSGSRAGMLSPSGRCRSFDNRADGFVPSEGVGVLILKRLSETDGDHIHGVIRGIGINQDGTTNGITAPSAVAQEQLIRQIYDEFGIDCAGIQMIEAHGTGTKLGDPVEFNALTRAFRHYTDRPRFCSLGSSKANMGHAQMAAGVVGIIKVLLAMKHRKLPPLLHHEQTNANIALDGSPFYVHTDARDWVVEAGGKRRAAVTSLGASGTNAHAVIEEAPVVLRPAGPHLPRLIALSARTAEARRQQAARLAQYCREAGSVDIADVSYTLLLGRQHFEHRLVCIVEDLAELGRCLDAWLAGGFGGAAGVLVSGPGAPPPSMPAVIDGAAAAALKLPRALASRYLAGEVPSFAELFAGEPRRRVSLPAYPFERASYWVSPAAPSTPGPAGVTTTVLTGDEFFLRDHRIRGVATLPAAMFLQLASAALSRSQGVARKGAAVRLENIAFLRPLRVDGGPVRVQTELRAAGGMTRFEIRSQSAGGDATSHCEGEISFAGPSDAPRLDLSAMRQGFRRVMTPAERFYEEFRELDIDYGRAFRGCVAMYTAPGAVLAQIELVAEVADTLPDFVVHPVVIDSALQCIRLLAAPEEAREVAVLFAIKQVEIIGPCSSRMWAWVRHADGSRGTGRIDIDLVDEGGRACVLLRGAAARRVAVEAGPKGPPAVALLPVWRVSHDARAGHWPDAWRPVAIAGGTREARDTLCGLYPAAHVLDLPHDGAEDVVERLVRAAPAFEHLFWLSPEARPFAPTADDLVRGQSRGVLEVFRLLEALLAAGYDRRPLGLTLVTHRAQPLHEAERIDPTHASVAGLAGSLAKEYPHWRLRAADVAEYDRASLEAVLGLSADPDGNTRLYRDRQWFSHCLVPIAAPDPGRPGFRDGGVYVIAGGAGGLGVALTEHLMSRYGARVAWLGRREKDARVDAAIAALSAFGPAPHYIRADATDAASLRRAHEEVRRQLGPVTGLIHSALVISGASLARMNEAQFHEVLRGKVDVSARLMEAFRGPSLEVALFLSSINSYLKAMGHASYAAACTFMDAFALEAGRTYGCTAKVINLGYCFNNAVDRADRGGAVRSDIDFIERGELLAGVEALLASPLRQVTLMKFSPAQNTRGMAVGEGGVVLGQGGDPSPPEGADAVESELRDLLAQLPHIQERMKEITALAI